MSTLQLGPEEHIIAIFRKHQFYLWVSAAKYVVLALLPVIAAPFLNNNTGNFGGLGMALYLGFLIILWVGFFIEWTDFMLDTWILTNERLVDVEQIALFSRRVSTLSLDRIQDITIEESGILETFLGIGNVLIQTASEIEQFQVKGARNPVVMKDMIQQAYREGREDILNEIAHLQR
jgi:uncharacterized membrane protein YdbT with pleckstrin-like domain